MLRKVRISTMTPSVNAFSIVGAIATGLGAGLQLREAVERARAYVRAALEVAPGFGGGHGPMGVPFEYIHRKDR